MQKNRSKTRIITVTAMLIAISVIIGIFCKNFLNFGAGPFAGLFRITFENLPIILAGILYGPIIGGVVGLASDMISYLLSNQVYPPNLIVTLGAIMVGVISGLVAKYLIKKKGSGQIIISGMLAHIVGSIIIKPIGLYQFYGMLVILRVPMYLLIAPLEIFLLCMLLKRKSFCRVIGYTREDKPKNEKIYIRKKKS